MTYYDKKTCPLTCVSSCCYFPKPGQYINDREAKEFRNGLENNLGKIHPVYSDVVRKTVESGNYMVKRDGQMHLACDNTKPSFDSCMTEYSPCVFLANSEDILSDKKACMIDPLKPEIRSEEHTSELQSHDLISYAVFCLKFKRR